VLFAASHPSLVGALALITPTPRVVRCPGYEWAQSVEERNAIVAAVVEHWSSSSSDQPWGAFAGVRRSCCAGRMREEVERHRGRLVKSLGDGMLATFDGPSRAISSAIAIRDRVRKLDLQIRAGLHTGECESLAGGGIGGLAVHIAARISSIAAAGEVLVSSTVRDLTVGSGQELADRGEHELKGVPRPWRIFAVEA
jgi:hypothetical protein